MNPRTSSAEKGQRNTLAQLRALTSLLLRNQATRGRLVALSALGVIGIIVATIVSGTNGLDATASGTRFVNRYALSLLTPVVALVFGTGTLGDLVEDRSLVYLWLPPVPRWIIAFSAWFATIIICTPFTIGVGLAIAAATGGGTDLLIGTFWATLLGMIAYTGLFVAVGFRFKRALIWGFAYLLIWENFVAQAGAGAARLSILSYLRSTLSAYTGVGLKLADRDLQFAFVVPVVVGILAVLATVKRLRTQDID